METNRIYNEDCVETMGRMPDGYIQTVVTSPPYWGLRDYGVEGQLGLEETPEEYANNLCDIFDELKRVLKDDGTFWLNIGDSYFSRQNNNRNGATDSLSGEVRGGGEYKTQKRSSDVVKEKDLVGIPWRVALEMQSRGWYLRNDIIWHKPSAMPESATDRCTTSHEHIFLFSKNKNYYYDHESISNSSGANKRDVWNVNPASLPDEHFAVYPEELITPCIKAGSPEGYIVYDPFFGAGTTGLVCEKLNRKWIGSELNEEYCDLARDRISPESDQEKLF